MKTVVAPTNRATRPAEPAAPAAEAGDGEVYLADACKPWEFATGPVPAYDSPLHQVFVAGMLYAEHLAFALTHWRPLPVPPRDLSQGGQHG